jgi:hypothetical protein
VQPGTPLGPDQVNVLLLLDRGEEADTMSLVGQRRMRQVGPLVKARWHLFSWIHEPASEVFELRVANEISVGQFPSQRDTTAYELNGEVTALLNGRGQGGHFTVEAAESEIVDPNNVYIIRLQPPRKFRVFIRQLSWEVEENENWMQVSSNLGDILGLPKWCKLHTASDQSIGGAGHSNL